MPIPSIMLSLVLGGLLLASVTSNVAQWRSASTAERLCAATLEGAHSAGREAAAKEALDQTAKLTESAERDRLAAEDAEKRRRAAEARAAAANKARMDAIPDHACAPGQEFQDAINATARGES